MRRFFIPALIALAGVSLAGQRSVLLETFTTQTCPYCPDAIRAADSAERAYHDTVAVLEYVQTLSGSAYTYRYSFYGVDGVPTAWFDGYYRFIGGGTPLYSQYFSRINLRKTVPPKARIDSVNFYIDGGTGHLDCVITLEDDLSSSDMPKAFGAVTEKDVQVHSTGLKGDHLVRVMPSGNGGENLAVFNAGQSQRFAWTFTPGSWNQANLSAVIWVQYTSGAAGSREVAQSIEVPIGTVNLTEGEAHVVPRAHLILRGKRLSFDLPGESWVSLSLYDVSGRQVASLASGTYPEGEHEVSLPALTAGVYTAVLATEFGTKTQRLVR